MSTPPDELDSLWFSLPDRERVEAALSAEAADAGYLSIDPDELSPYGRWLHGEEDPTVRRYAIAESARGWTGVFPSHPDWDHDFAPAIAERLGCQAACLMLHDGDVFTLHLHEGDRLAASHLSSPVHFDREARPADELGVDPQLIVPFCREGTSAEQVRLALTPPGRIDVDGRLSFERMAALLGLGPQALLSYALLVDEGGLALRETFSDLDHLAFRFEDEESMTEAGSGGQLLRFPGSSDESGA